MVGWVVGGGGGLWLGCLQKEKRELVVKRSLGRDCGWWVVVVVVTARIMKRKAVRLRVKLSTVVF